MLNAHTFMVTVVSFKFVWANVLDCSFFFVFSWECYSMDGPILGFSKKTNSLKLCFYPGCNSTGRATHEYQGKLIDHEFL